MLLGGAFYQCKGCNQVYFIDLKALHEAHTLIFVIACIHITYSCLVMFISSRRMEKWLEWEDMGRDSQGRIVDTKDLERLQSEMRMPSDHNGHLKTFAFACGEQVCIFILDSSAYSPCGVIFFDLRLTPSPPPPTSSPFLHSSLQFFVGVDAFTFIALRKFYIAKHELKHDFGFHKFLNKGIQHDFSEMLGICGGCTPFLSK